MVFYSPLDLDIELLKYVKKLDIEYNGRKYDDIFADVSAKCPHIYTDDEFRNMCSENMHKIKEEFGFRGLRVWYHSAKKNLMLKNLMKDEDGWGGDDAVERKYFNLIPMVWEFHNNLLFKSDYFLNYMRYFHILEDVFFDEYGSLMNVNVVSGEHPEIYYIMKTIYLSCFDEKIVKALQDELKYFLRAENAKYYLSQDLEKKENLEELYLHICEENYDGDGFKGREIFHSDDGFGNYYTHSYESWTDDCGARHSKTVIPEITIKNFNKKGTVDDRVWTL